MSLRVILAFLPPGLKEKRLTLVWNFTAKLLPRLMYLFDRRHRMMLDCAVVEFICLFFFFFWVQGCKSKIGLRNILCSIQKEEKAWWKRLLKSEEKPAPYLKVDWNKWCDEDEESEHCKFIWNLATSSNLLYHC